ncbi:hypothetical protein BBK82_05440 [Lentzea guizhouensis]|uniref:PE domain-containing protein n=1 Tax=Lentzea guizhouensis TaxID=1586287 RepID=A0A1B2HD04_9PSEU|nr:hypothetical protein [Lentzea guizhouensis]ANZ35605.1 hypothetical protein BBK82_05440 [Lentzea guizhouensis]
MLMFDAVTPFTAIGKAVGSAAAAAGAAAGAAGAGTTRFAVDPDQAQKMIDGLEAAAKQLKDLMREAEFLTSTGAPGPDPFSGWATIHMRKAAGEEPGGYAWANQKAVEALETTVANIKKALAEYRGTDDDAKTAMGR